MVVIFQKTKVFPKLRCTLAMLLIQIVQDEDYKN